MAFKKPEKKREGTKFLLFGEAGSGKTPTALSFNNIALVDSDSGSNFYDMSNVVATTEALTYQELNDDLDDLEMEEEDFNEVGTFVVDSITRFHESMTHGMNKIAENRAINAGREAEAEGLSFREYGKMKIYYEEFFSRMMTYSKQAKNLVFVAEQKDKNENVNGQPKKVGVIPNAQKDIEYDFDVVVRTFQHDTGEKDENGKAIKVPKGEIIKDRSGTFTVGEIIDKPHYDLWKDAIEKNQQGKQRDKEEIKQVKDSVEEEMNSLDDGEALRKEAKSLANKLAKDGKKDEVQSAVSEALEGNKLANEKDPKKIKKAIEALKAIQ